MPIAANGPTNPDDVFLWPDGFWCFREEMSRHFLRDKDYRVILPHSVEWLGCTREAGIPPL